MEAAVVDTKIVSNMRPKSGRPRPEEHPLAKAMLSLATRRMVDWIENEYDVEVTAETRDEFHRYLIDMKATEDEGIEKCLDGFWKDRIPNWKPWATVRQV